MVFVTTGNVFGWADVASYAGEFLPAIIPMFAPLLFGAVVVLPVVLRRILRPLNAAAKEASAIDMQALDRRLPTLNLPSELRPLVDAVNGALDRLDAGVARERLFTANAAHELRTPVAILMARIDAMPNTHLALDDLRRDARRMAVLIDQLLAAARLGRADRGPAERFDLLACVRAVVADCAPLALRGSRELDLQAPDGPVPVEAHAAALASAVANLMENALRAEPVGGTVEVIVTASPAVLIIDHGPGITAQDAPFIFEPFWRKDERSPGTGLGLTIVREVARLHGGGISVTTTPGGGATFRLHLPASTLRPQSPSARQARAMPER
jgi:signal transduction histidine kinase